MTKKNHTTLNFTYNIWNCCISKDQITKSVSKMKKIIKDNIKSVLMDGHKDARESAFKLHIPFFNRDLSVCPFTKVKIDFSDNCDFSCNELTSILKRRNEAAEISVYGNINVTIVW